MARKKKTPLAFEGRWHIASMSMWDEDYLDAEEQAYIEFQGNRRTHDHLCGQLSKGRSANRSFTMIWSRRLPRRTP
jgi:hypothetical protein